MKIAVCIPTYNREKTIVKAINSVINQREQDIDIIVFDNKSTDDTVNVVSKQFGDKIQLYVNDTNLGYVGNINKCLSLSEKYDWIAILHSDDFHTNDSFKYFKPYLVKYQDAGIIYSKLHTVDENDITYRLIKEEKEELFFSKGYEALLSFHERQVPCSGTIYNSKAIKEVGVYSDEFPYSADEEYGSRIASKYDIVQIPKIVGYYRIHPDNLQIQTWLKKDFFNNFFLMREKMLKSAQIDSVIVDKIVKKSKASIAHSISVRLAQEGYWKEALEYNLKSLMVSPFTYFSGKILIKSAYVFISILLTPKINKAIHTWWSRK